MGMELSSLLRVDLDGLVRSTGHESGPGFVEGGAENALDMIQYCGILEMEVPLRLQRLAIRVGECPLGVGTEDQSRSPTL